MKHIVIVLSLGMNCFTLTNAQSSNKNYNSVLANKLHADEYGMKNYILVLLKPGDNSTLEKAAEDSIFRGHLNNMGRLADNGDLVVAGPFGKNDKYAGLFVLNAGNFDEAKKLLETDPAIQAKLLDPELYIWYGSAALQETFKIHKTIQKSNF